MMVTRREFLGGMLATIFATGSDAGRRVTADVATKVAPVIFLPLVMKAGVDNQLWVNTDRGIVYLDLFIENCSFNGACTVTKG